MAMRRLLQLQSEPFHSSVKLARSARALSRSQALEASQVPGIDTLMVANRGEIACRVMRTCQKLGIETVAVYSEADADSMHVRMADQKFLLGPAPTTESYLRMDKLLEAVDATGTNAVHPGYGFLSENSAFSEALEDKGVKFLGPRKLAIEVMGDKKNSKDKAEAAGVSVIPGCPDIVRDVEHAKEIANDIGYPVMIKAVHGGGGKGMRPAWNDGDLEEGYTLSKGEAKAFGNDDLLVEKFIDEPRHIEIQVLGDQHGNYVYLNERECSIQRRNQKVVEEAPSTFLDPETRRAMGEQAVALARAVDYESAGTVEFLVDSDKNFYFLEMNTRLQVEHPITECITGVDLVEQMIRVAAGQPLSITQDDIGIDGWAVEARVYAEDSVNYMPSIGQLTTYREPVASNPEAEWPDVRIDTGVEESSEISMYYDPMICKLITYGKDRAHALSLMENALDTYVIEGVQHNVPLIRDIIKQPRFIEGDTSTKFLEEVYPDRFQGYALNKSEQHKLVAAAAFMHAVRAMRDQELENIAYGPESRDLPSTLAVAFRDTVNDTEDKIFEAKLSVSGVGLQVSIDGEAPVAVSSAWTPGSLLWEGSVGDDTATIQTLSRDGQKHKMVFCGTEFQVAVRDARHQKYFEHFLEVSDEVNADHVASPMPGVVISVAVQPGDPVVAGQAIAVVEAMKMQNSLLSPREGIIKAVHFTAGDKVGDDEVIIELEQEETADADA